jgi:hypothetical protein
MSASFYIKNMMNKRKSILRCIDPLTEDQKTKLREELLSGKELRLIERYLDLVAESASYFRDIYLSEEERKIRRKNQKIILKNNYSHEPRSKVSPEFDKLLKLTLIGYL